MSKQYYQKDILKLTDLYWLWRQFNVQSKSCVHKGAGKQNAPSKRIPTKYVPVVWHLQKYAECLLCKYGRSSIFFAMIFSDIVCPAGERYKYTSDRISRFLVTSFFCLLYFFLSSLFNYSCLLYVFSADQLAFFCNDIFRQCLRKDKYVGILSKI